jgi:hypothetical protein
MDLVLARGQKVLACIEIKTTDAPSISKGMMQSIEDLNCKNNFVISYGNASHYKLSEGLQVLSLNDFVSVFLSKITK